jgi:phenylacetate-CoA ligase
MTPSSSDPVSPEHATRLPLLTREGQAMFRRLQQHPHGPRWNHTAGDRVGPDDLAALGHYRRALEETRKPFGREPPAPVLAWLAGLAPKVPWLRARLPNGPLSESAFRALDTTSREDVARRPESLIPDDADLDAMIAYRTAGTTGHALIVPHAVRAAASYPLLIDFALRARGITLPLGPEHVACLLVGAQRHTVTYPTVLSVWRQSGFAKLNLTPGDWPTPDSPHHFFEDTRPGLLTGDPLAFAELLRLGIRVRPKALLTTAVALSTALKRRLEAHFACPVIDWYSLTETGPIAAACPAGEGYHVLPHDLFVETLGPDGLPTSERGEVTVTGGRNPYLPLLRYRTGDFGRLAFEPCVCGDPMPRLLELEGRAPVLLRAADGGPVNTVDVSRLLRELPLVQHELVQRKDLSLTLTVRAVPGASQDLRPLERLLRGLFGDVPVAIRWDDGLGERKVVPYRSELLLEE